MDEALQKVILAACERLPDGCRFARASEEQLRGFEREFGPLDDA
jgi:hypothetical protein